MLLKDKYNNLKVSILAIFSLIFNQYYANQGLFPAESLGHYDISFRILKGDIPLLDYWTVSGVFIDYIQALILFFFGDSIQIYILHASIVNSLITILVYFFFKIIFKLDANYSFFYSFLFAVLAYPTSGTLYIDHHAALLSFVSMVFFIFYYNNEKSLNLFISLIFLAFAFFTKIVPASYLSIVIFFALVFKAFYEKKFSILKYFFFFSVLIFIFFLILVIILKIPLFEILNQYIIFPSTIGKARFNIDIFSINSLSVYKFIFIPVLLLIFSFVKKINLDFKKNYADICNILLIFCLVIVLYLHQVLTRNQEFIYFLIPVLFCFLSVQFIYKNEKKNKIKNLLILFFCLIVVFKYHLRLNENRRFHELENVNLKKSVPAILINKKFYGLKWITKDFAENPNLEINKINGLIFELKNSNLNNSMVISNYSFLSIVLDKNLNAPARWFFPDGNVYPISKKNEYFKNYQLFLIKLLERKDIQNIYFAFDVNESEILRYLNKNCFVSFDKLIYMKKISIKKKCKLI